MFILASSHRNDGDTIAASDADHGTRRRTGGIVDGGSHLRALRGRLGRDGSALEARHVAAGPESRVAFVRTVRIGEQHLALLRRAGVRRDLDVPGRNGTLEIRASV